MENLHAKIKSSDFLVSDDNCTHRLVGLRYESKTMHGPEITIICARHEMAVAKQIAFSLGKRIYQKSALSAMLFRNYNSGQKLRHQDYNEFAKIYASFICSKKIDIYFLELFFFKYVMILLILLLIYINTG